MAIFKCKMCGGDLDITQSSTVFECEYCGTKQTIPNLDDERKLNLFNRANRLRISGEFDKAASIYENIVAEYPEDAEGYWGLVICNYGIEYVDDPATAEKIPTCHRASFDSVLEDENYLSTIKYAHADAREIYRKEATELERIREEILLLCKNEPPYDIFICYKETDEKGDRTIDSFIAQNVYDALTDKGYRVFFARITLEDKLGMQYEPYIFAALNSAKIMLCFGTKYEHFNSIWVKNEWSRFLKLMAKDKTKVLIPCYKDMDANDMPDEFRVLQGQDMGEIGAIQDILRGTQKIIPKTEEANSAKQTKIETTALDSLLKCVDMLLEDEKWEEADDYCDKVLSIDPKNAEAYVGKLMAELKIRFREELANCETSFEHNSNYKKALDFADGRLLNMLKSYSSSVEGKGGRGKLEELYLKGQDIMNSAQTKEELLEAIELFKSISGYKNSDELTSLCFDKIEKLRIQQKETKIQKEKQAYRERESKSYRSLRIKLIVAVVLVVAFISVILYAEFNPKARYNDAVKYIELRKHSKAIEILEDLNYSDSKILLEECRALLEYKKVIEAPSVGETFILGKYEQDGNTENGAESIEWIVIADQSDGILAISKYALTFSPYSTQSVKNYLKAWLENEFLNIAFNEHEQYFLLNSSGLHQAKAFLANSYQLDDYMKLGENEDGLPWYMSCKPTPAALKEKSTFVNNENGNCYWWVDDEHYISPNGYKFGTAEATSDFGVRPVIKLNPNSAN